MKITLTFKDPDGPYYTLQEAAKRLAASDPDGRSVMDITGEIQRKLEPWVKYMEYVHIEFDLDAGTATVLK